MSAKIESLRLCLRRETAQAHDRLDASMRAASDWESETGYSAFLQIQYAARRSVEEWLLANAPQDCVPPVQTPLIVRDLDALHMAIPDHCPGFDFHDASEAATLGIAWALAGSSLGNRTILKQVQKRDELWPVKFLSDPAMPDYWAALRRRIERPALVSDARRAGNAATALFEHFLAAVSRQAAPQGAFHSDRRVEVAAL